MAPVDPYTDDGTFDYKSLPRDAIEYAIQHIDPQAFPQNLANARAALEARQSGSSPEPAPLMDQKTDTALTLWAERILGSSVCLYAVLGVIHDEFVVPLPGRHMHYDVIELHGRTAWLAAAGLVVAAGVVILGGFDQSEPPKIRPKFRLPFTLACAAVALAVGIQIVLRTIDRLGSN